MSLQHTFETIADTIREFVEKVFPENVSVYLASPTTDAPYIHESEKMKERLDTTLSEFSIKEFSTSVAKFGSEEFQSSVDAFNNSIGQQARDFVLTMGFTKYSDSVLSEIRQKPLYSEEKNPDEVNNITNTKLIAKLCLVLDITMLLATDDRYATLKNAFYTLLQSISETLAVQSTKHLSTLWDFVESRAHKITESVFNPQVTSNRVAILGLCNSLTDRLYSRSELGELDSYAKDSFSDTVQARVRILLANLLKFDDSTGLNKYFTVANRKIREPALSKVVTSDDKLLEDVLRLRKLLRDPYTYLKNSHQLATASESLVKLHTYFLDAERKFSKVTPCSYSLEVHRMISEIDQKHLMQKYAETAIFPEQYWVSPFEDKKSGPDYDKISIQDQDCALSHFDSSQFRRLLVLQIYLVSCLFLELSLTHKKLFLENAGALATTKHITEEYTPETLVPRFSRIKRDTISQIQTWDSRWASALQTLQNSEKNWWAWLIYGKSKDGKPLLAARTLSSEDLQETKTKFEQSYPGKTKRYFNTHATPQLSQRMKTATGIHLLVDKDRPKIDFADQIDLLATKIENQTDKGIKAELIEERMILIWKQTRLLRDENWLDLDNQLVASDLVNPETNEGQIKKELKEREDGEGEKEKEKKNNEIQESSRDDHMDIDSTGKRDTVKEETRDAENCTFNVGSDGKLSLGKIAGDQMAKILALQKSQNIEKSVSEVIGESVFAIRKRERECSPESSVGEEDGPKTSKPRFASDN